MSTCAIEGCERTDVKARDLCVSHYERYRKYGDPLGTWRTERTCEHRDCTTTFIANHWRQRFCCALCAQRARKRTNPPCKVDGCTNHSETIGLCAAHYRRERLGGGLNAHIPLGEMHNGQPLQNVGKQCRIHGCGKPAKTRLLCTAHYSRYLNGTLDTDASPIRKFRSAGEGHIDKNGYRVVSAKGHPNAWATGHIFEHTLVMSTKLGRALLPNESVHHLNGDRADNRVENLELWVTISGKHRKGQRVTDRVADAITTLERYAPDLLVKADVQLCAVA